MPKIVTSKKLNIEQLGVELGRVPIKCVVGEYVEAENVTVVQLEQAINSHTPNALYVDPQAPSIVDQDKEFRDAVRLATTLTQLKDAILGNIGPGAQVRIR